VSAVSANLAERPHQLGLWRPALRIGLGVWTLTRIGFLVFAAAATSVAPPPARSRVHHWIAWPFQVYDRWDAGFFVRIAARGYFQRGPNDVRVAFFPGYPLLGRVFAGVLGLGRATPADQIVALTLIAWVGAAVAGVVLWRFVAESAGPRAATTAVVALLAGPYSLFLMAGYSEGLFLALAVSAWLLAHRGRWVSAGLLCGAATLVRINGLFLLGGLVVVYLVDSRESGRRVVRAEALALTAPLVAVGAYFSYLKVRTGRWDAWFRAQARGWNRHLVWPWESLRRSIEHYQRSSSSAVHFQAAMELVFAALFVIALIAFARQRSWAEFTYVGLTTLSLLTSTFYLSVPRATLTAFPVLVLFARWAVAPRHRSAAICIAVLSGVLLLINSGSFVRGYWAG
jgi:Gpi18-like mannosyltransferase